MAEATLASSKRWPAEAGSSAESAPRRETPGAGPARWGGKDSGEKDSGEKDSGEKDTGEKVGRAVHPRLQAVLVASRYHGRELDPREFVANPAEAAPSAASLCLWARNAGMWARAVRLQWRHLMRLGDDGPVVLLFTDGSAGLLTGVNAGAKGVFLQDPCPPA